MEFATLFTAANAILLAKAFAIYIAVGLVLFYILFVTYVMIMNVKRSRDRKRLTRLAYVMSWPVLVVGIVSDVLLNQLYFSVVCWDFKHFGTVTSRMKGYKYREGTAWQKKVSAWVELHIDDFEDTPEGHI
jgi:cytochrome bd-type quinol oxidase subunit 2